MSNLYTSLWWRSSWYFSMHYFDVTGVYWCRSRCRCEKIGFDICLLEANSAYRVQNPFQNITLHGYGTGAALRGWPVYWVPEKFLTTPHRECRHSPYLFLIFLFCHSHPSHLSLSREEEDFFEVSTQAKNYTCQRHDFGFDDFVMESRFGRRFFLRMFFLHARHLYRYSRDILHWCQIISPALLRQHRRYIPHFTLFNKMYKTIFLRENSITETSLFPL